jgi:hypothetical protein
MQQYSSVLESVRTAVNIADPMAIFQFGAPPDGYDDEITDLTERIIDRGDPADSTTVLAVFLDWFGVRIPIGRAQTVAALIHEMLPAA